MDIKNSDNSKIVRALADASRLMIINMLSDQELSFDKILENMHISQSRLSHHMKVLCSSGLITSRHEGQLAYYQLNSEALSVFKPLLDDIMSKTRSTIIW